MQSASRKRQPAKTVGEVPAVAALAAHAKALDALDRSLRQCLPDPLRRQCCLADLRAGRLVFLASSPAWAAKLRFHQTALLAAARLTTGAPVGKFAVKVAPLPPVPPEQTRRRPLSHTAAEHLKAAAHSVADPELRAAYLRLASLAE
ncbi:MAG: DUF721 domain-containing protein [Proteobacteria bacterium]|nr:DUF721 domain-containing protein [Pseudomonadota bacterium]